MRLPGGWFSDIDFADRQGGCLEHMGPGATSTSTFASSDAQPCLTDTNGQPITSLYAYDPDGKLLPQILLYDQPGSR